MPNSTSLLFASQVIGALLLLSTMILVGMRRIYFDYATKEPVEFELPLFGKIKTQAPSLALIFVGAFLVIYPISRPHEDRAVIQGEISTPAGKPVTLLLVAIPHYQETLDQSGTFSLPVPLIQDASYRVKFIVDQQVVADQEATLINNAIHLKKVVVAPTRPVYIGPTKEVGDEDLRSYGIPLN